MGYFNAIRRHSAADLLEREGPLLVMPPYETITGYKYNLWVLTTKQRSQVKAVAGFVGGGQTSAAAITSIRVTGYISAAEAQNDLGDKRAQAVAQALVADLGGISSPLVQRISWTIEDRGLGDMAKVEIYLWAGPTPPPIPPYARKPSPAELLRPKLNVPLPAPETPEERLERVLRTILRTKVPEKAPGRSFNDWFWKQFNSKVDGTLERLRVPHKLRKPLREGLRKAFERGSESLLDQVLEASELPQSTREALKQTLRALGKQPTR